MELVVVEVADDPPGLGSIEIVERKGKGHPDTICDAIAERVSRRLSAHYLERFGAILHHNVDKVLLVGGASRAELGGGEVLAPIEIVLAGRATESFRGEAIPTREIAVEAAKEWLRENLADLDVERHVVLTPRLRPGSSDLSSIYARGARANDTSIGVGFAPLTDLERAVLAVEYVLTSADTQRLEKALGDDVKVMGARRGGRIELTIACAMVAKHVKDAAAYARAVEHVRAIAEGAVRAETTLDVDIAVNTGDDPAHGQLYLTVTGTSAEAGDDGEVGRGNRASGLITPMRPMTLEASAGKNPVTHVGKIYNLVATRAAEDLARDAEILDANVLFVSRIGRRVVDPYLARVALKPSAGASLPERAAIERALRARLEEGDALRDALLRGEIDVY